MRETVVYSNVDKSISSFILGKDTESRAFFPREQTMVIVTVHNNSQ